MYVRMYVRTDGRTSQLVLLGHLSKRLPNYILNNPMSVHCTSVRNVVAHSVVFYLKHVDHPDRPETGRRFSFLEEKG